MYRQRINHRFQKLHYMGIGNGPEYDDVFAYRDLDNNFKPVTYWTLIKPIKWGLLFSGIFKKAPKHNTEEAKLKIVERVKDLEIKLQPKHSYSKYPKEMSEYYGKTVIDSVTGKSEKVIDISQSSLCVTQSKSSSTGINCYQWFELNTFKKLFRY